MSRNSCEVARAVHKCGREGVSAASEEHGSWSNARPRAHWVRGAAQLHAEYTSSAVCNSVVVIITCERMAINSDSEGDLLASSGDIIGGDENGADVLGRLCDTQQRQAAIQRSAAPGSMQYV